MIPKIVLPSEIDVYSERPEILDFFKKQQFSGTRVSFFKKYSLRFENLKSLADNSVFVDPKVTSLETEPFEFLETKYVSGKMHFIMPQEEVLDFLHVTHLPETAVIPVPCDGDVFKQRRKKITLFCDEQKLKNNLNVLSGIAGSSDSTKILKSKLILASESELPVLLLGESGTGKSYAASFIHRLSNRRKKSYKEIDIGTVAENLAESELFGSSYGAFTGAVNNKGLLLESDGGTLFIDEIGNASLAMQAKLLRFVETGKIRAVGSSVEKQINTRLIFATNGNLSSMVKQNLFRADFYNRINVFTIEFEPLREHAEDISEIAQAFLAEKSYTITSGAISLLESYNWPGNIRELQNCLDRAMLFCQGKCIDEQDITFG